MKKDIINIELEKHISFQIDFTSNFSKTFRRIFHKKYMNNDISMDEFAILWFIKSRPDITQAAIGRFLFKGKAHVGKILNLMESKGLLTREYIEHSNTTKNSLTEKGELFLKKGLKETKQIENTLNSTFTKEETKQFLSYLKRYRDSLNSIVEVKIK